MNVLRFVIGEKAPTGASPFKCDIFGAAIGATAQNISDAVNFLSNQSNNRTNKEIADANNQIALQIARENNQQQSSMNAYNNQFSHNEADLAYQRQLELQKREFEYQSYENQVRMLKDAGINPGVYFAGKAGLGSPSAPSAPQAQPHGSGVTPSMPNLTSPHMEAFQMVSPAAALRDIGSAFESLSNSDKTREDIDILRKAKADILSKYHSDSKIAEMDAIIKNYYGMEEASANVIRIKNQALELIYNALLLAKQGKTEDAKQQLIKAQSVTEKETAKLRKSERKKVENENSVFFELTAGQLKALEASANASNAAASASRSQAALTDEYQFRESLKNNVLEAARVYDHDRFVEAVMGEFEHAAKQNQFTDEQIDKIRKTLPSLVEQMENDAKLNKPWSAEYFVDRLLGAIHAGVNAAATTGQMLILK